MSDVTLVTSPQPAHAGVLCADANRMADVRRPEAGTHLGGRERGAALVEFALILPVLLTLALGIFSAGLAYNRQIALTNAAREASRFGATLTLGAATGGTTEGWLGDVADAAQQAATGELAAGVEDRMICVAFVHPDGTEPGDVTTRLIRTDDGDEFSNPAGSDACHPGGDGHPSSERRVQVRIQRGTTIEALVYSRDLTLTGSSVTLFEASR
jgi:hypothetical protein